MVGQVAGKPELILCCCLEVWDCDFDYSRSNFKTCMSRWGEGGAFLPKGRNARIAGIFRGVYISRISLKGPSLLTLKPRNLIIESGCGQLECILLSCG